MTITATTIMVNTAGVSQTTVTLLESIAQEAVSRWSDVLAGNAQITVQIEITDAVPSGRADGTWIRGSTAGARDGFSFAVGNPAWQLQGNKDPGSGADILIRFAPDYLLSELYLDPTPAVRGDTPAGRTDAVSVMVHELGHALGFTGYYNESNGTYGGNFKSGFDSRLTFIENVLFFDGPNVRAVYGDKVPLTDNNYTHYGNSNLDPRLHDDPLLGLMNGVVYYRGYNYEIAPIDLAFMADSGVGTIRNDILDLPFLTAMRGGAGNDTITGGEQNNLLQGDADNDTIAGNGGNDRLIGGTGEDTLSGGRGNDRLDGGKGADSMAGGAGNDTYFVDSARDRVVEKQGTQASPIDSGGIDTVVSTVAFDLSVFAAQSVERLTLSGTRAIEGRGNALDNRLTGNNADNRLFGFAGDDTLSGQGGNDSLRGGLGRDTLTGGTGADQFVFNTTLNAISNRDVISDFRADEGDMIAISASVLRDLAEIGALPEGAFRAAAGTVRARDEDDLLLYSTTSGLLSFDPDGSGARAAIAVALLRGAPTLAADDILIIA